MDLEKMFQDLIAMGGSDIHIKIGNKPIFRVNGDLFDYGDEIISFETMNKIVLLLTKSLDQDEFKSEKEADFRFVIKGIGRFRVNVYMQRGTYAIAIRRVSHTISKIEDLKLPDIVKKIALLSRGLVLITGTAGSGKSTTMASIIEYINQNRRANIITIEDPIEFLFKDKKSIIQQREVGSDTKDFKGSLRYLLRQDPDIVVIGEIRDQETMATALRAANTGHLVFSTLHTTDAKQTIDRILSFFEGHQQNEIRSLLAATLEASISQRLIPTVEGESRIVATEVMIKNDYVKDCILNSEKRSSIKDAIKKGSFYGMHGFDDSIFKLYSNGMISYEDALLNATSPAEFEMRVKGVDDSSNSDYSLGDYDYNMTGRDSY
ncbi:MAG: type IV pili twitching motility protein PilT [Candidatus Cloacimonadota bacterium]|nr:MAG: type IV pili twitching motility protein PilT [Candidatus Cloacimonadota bacterium]PIE77667.1 MAG: type IV pili twitching motility protein PilT [Candidatus Delongbacteria bacterium]